MALTAFLAALAVVGGCRPSGERSDSLAAGATGRADAASRARLRETCAGDNGGITLPAGFCASVFADDAPGARHVVVAPNGDVFVALSAPRRPRAGAAAERGTSASGGVLALRDTSGDGRADVREAFGDPGGSGLALHDGRLYVDAGSAVLRYTLPAGRLRPSGAPDTVVAGLPTGGHGAHPIVLGRDGALFVNIGSQTNSCQVADRRRESPGHDPCTELETRAGIWGFDAAATGQRPALDRRFATGIRNAMGLDVHPVDGALWATQHGRDQLAQNWPRHYSAEESAALPAEQLMRVERGDDFGWPYCYYDQNRRALVLAPEYGGSGADVGRCAERKAPEVTFPGHWGPNDLLFYTGQQFPARYRNGAFVAFHGSWNRAPLPQAGYNVTFVPFDGARPSGTYEVFADGFAGGEVQNPGAARHRPTGLAQGPDGSLYITDDQRGRIWRVVYTGEAR